MLIISNFKSQLELIQLYSHSLQFKSIRTFTLTTQKMNGDIDFEKVIEMEFHNITYLLTVRAQINGLSLEAQQKHTGQIWQSFFQPQQIQRITSTAGNLKRYPIFTKMLMSALNRSTETVSLDLMTHRDIEAQSNRRNGSQIGRASDPRITNKRYLIINYMGQFDKVHYPLPLQWNSDPQSDRLKLTIRRLSQQIKFYQQNSDESNLYQQISMVKHENQLLKSKLKNTMHSSFHKENIASNFQINDQKLKKLQEQNKLLVHKLEQTKDELAKKENELKEVRQQLVIVTSEMGAVRKQYEEVVNENKSRKQMKQLEKLYSDKFKILQKENKQLMSQIQFHKQKQKKNQIKINHLQKQLELMIKNKDKNYKGNLNRKPNQVKIYNHTNKTPSKLSERKSNKTIHNYSSDEEPTKNSIRKSNLRNTKQTLGKKKSSVYDSDTQSSRMRRMNNYVSPYRQTSKPNKLTSNRSNKSLNSSRSRSQSAQKKSVKKYNNISNLYSNPNNHRNTLNRNKQRNNRSIQRKSQINFIEEQSFNGNQSNRYQLTEPEQTVQQINQEEISDSSSSSFDGNDGNRVQNAIAKLRNRRKNTLDKQKNEGKALTKKKITNIEERISSIAQGLRKKNNGAV